MHRETGTTLAAAVLAMALPAAEFHVDPGAAPGGDGSAARPFSTLAAARDGLRAARRAGRVAQGERVEIVLAPGDYIETEGFALDAQDGGTSAAAPVVWRAAEHGTARVVGAHRIPKTAFTPVSDAAILARIPEEARGKVWQADVSAFFPRGVPAMKDEFEGTPPPPVLFLNHGFGTLARWPNREYALFSNRVDRGSIVRMTPGGARIFTPGAFVCPHPRAKRWNFAEGVWMNGYWTHDWHNHSVRAASYGMENGTNDVIRIAANIPFGILGETWGRKERRFFAFNIIDELDMPGEWFLDRKTNTLYFHPPRGGLSDKDEVLLASSGAPLVKSATAISHVRFEGIVFEYSYGTGVALSGNDIRLEGCRILCCAMGGVSLHGDANIMRRCEVAHTGKAGVTAGGGDRKTLRRADSLFERNHIHDFARFQRTHVAGFDVDGCGLTFRANVIHDAPNSAVFYGGNEHLFEYNNVYDVLLETGDAGAYYSGKDWTSQGNVLRFNYTHDLGSEGAMANTMGFYFDDCDCGDEVYGNIFHNVARGIMIGGGREHPVRNNIFSHCLVGMSIDNRGMRWPQWNRPDKGWGLEEKAKAFSYTNGTWAARYPRLADIMNDHPREPLYNPVENNIFIDCTRWLVAFEGRMPMERMAPIANNVAVNTRGTNDVAYARPNIRIEAAFTWLNGTKDAPCAFGLEGAANGDFHFSPGSVILMTCPGFAPIPVDRIPPSLP